MPAEERAQEALNPDAGIPQPELGVSAHPVDQYVAPAAGQQLSQLAHSLSSLNPALEEFAHTQQEKATAAGKRAGAEAFERTAGDYAEAVRSGQLPSHFNPFARFAAREQYGQLVADKFQSDMQSDPEFLKAVEGATTMQAFDQAAAKFRGKWDGTNLSGVSHSDSAFQNTFQSMRAAHLADMRKAFAGKVEENFQGLTAENFSANQSATIRQHMESGDFHTNPELLQQTLRDQTQHMLDLGFSPRLIAQANVNSLESLARGVARGDIGDGQVSLQDVWDLAKSMPGSGDTPLYDDAKYFAEMRDRVSREALTLEYQTLRTQRAQDALKKEQGTHDAWQQFLDDRDAGKLQDSSVYIDAMRRVNPAEAKKFGDEIATLTGATWKSKEMALRGLTEKMGLHPSKDDPDHLTRDEVVQQLQAKHISPQDAIHFLNMIQKRDNPHSGHGKTEEESALADPVYKAQFLGSSGYSHRIAAEGETVMTSRHTAQAAINEQMIGDWFDFHAANPTATTKEKEAFLRSEFDSLYDREVDSGDKQIIGYTTSAHTSTRHYSMQDFTTAPVLPQSLVEETMDGLKSRKLDKETIKRLAAFNLTTAADIAQAIRAQAGMYGIQPSPSKPK